MGHRTYELEDADRAGRKLRMDVWYPAADDNEAFSQYPHGSSRVAHEAAPVAAGNMHPLLVYSHGHGNSSTHNTVYPESLASYGFIVASPNHTGNTDGDLSRGDLSTTDRPADVSFVIDTLLAPGTPAGDAFAGEIAPDKIGVTGYSFGGYTTFATAAGVSYRGTTVPADERVKAILPISRGSFYEQPFDLSQVEVPALVVAGKDDEFDLDSWARTDFGQIRSADKYLALLAGADHTDVGWSLCQQSPADKACFNDLELATISQYGVAFFSRYLEGDTSFDSMLTVAYAAEHLPKVEFWQQAIVDTNSDGRATLVEFGRLKDNFGRQGTLASYSRGDFNRDRRVDLADFGLLKLNFSGPPAAVPEPGGLVLLGLGLVAAWGWPGWGRRRFGQRVR
ncbi:MAG: PEP-CTERM sorting domain-containing protein [Pirellulales bacterium]